MGQTTSTHKPRSKQWLLMTSIEQVCPRELVFIPLGPN